MDIRRWPLDQIMQLPDCCFGSRWKVSCVAVGVTDGPTWDIAEIAFPERIVLWEFRVWGLGALNIADTGRVALGDQLPTTVAMMDALEPFIPGYGIQGPDPRVIVVPSYTDTGVSRLRMPVRTAGRRLVLEASEFVTAEEAIVAVAIVSSIPTEVPDWLISGPGRSL